MQEDYGRIYAHLYHNHWWWRSHEAILLRTLRSLRLPGPVEILDVGCGDGLFFPELRNFGTVSGIEVDASLIAPGSPHRPRISNKPLGDPAHAGRRFDLITALDVVEHIDDDRAAIDAMVHMLRPGGFLVLTVPAFMCLWDHHDEINGHFRRYTARDLRERLAGLGQTVELRYVFPSLFFGKLVFRWLNRLRLVRRFSTTSLPRRSTDSWPPGAAGKIDFCRYSEFRSATRSWP